MDQNWQSSIAATKRKMMLGRIASLVFSAAALGLLISTLLEENSRSDVLLQGLLLMLGGGWVVSEFS